jgi:MoxR-like ATPase
VTEQLVETAEGSISVAEGRNRAQRVQRLVTSLREEIHRVFVGQQELVDFVLSALIADGHVLIEGVPGLGKTLLVRTLASAVKLPMSRIQFTPDLMPADITGTNVLAETEGGGHQLRFQPGPLVASIILADEINRATPKTQSALLEAMQERQISVAGRTIRLPEPFMVLATQNPIEQEGTYPLPEAQLDRFMVKLLVDYPTEPEYDHILERTTGAFTPKVLAEYSGEDILAARAIVREVPASQQVRSYAVRITMATQPGSPISPPTVRKYVAFGAGPRAAQSLLLMGKVKAILGGRFAVSCEDIRAVALPVMRHRLVLNFTGISERITPDTVVKAAVAAVSELSK